MRDTDFPVLAIRIAQRLSRVEDAAGPVDQGRPTNEAAAPSSRCRIAKAELTASRRRTLMVGAGTCPGSARDRPCTLPSEFIFRVREKAGEEVFPVCDFVPLLFFKPRPNGTQTYLTISVNLRDFLSSILYLSWNKCRSLYIAYR